MPDEPGSADLAARHEARVADLVARLDDAVAEATAWRGRHEAVERELATVREELSAVEQELRLVQASRSYLAAERLRRLLRR